MSCWEFDVMVYSMCDRQKQQDNTDYYTNFPVGIIDLFSERKKDERK